MRFIPTAPSVSSGAVTAATDVYALGVILYQLLIGHVPYVTDSLNLSGMAEAISDAVPMKIEQAIATDGDAVCAEQEALRATTSRDFLLEMLGNASPEASAEANQGVTISKFLDRSVPKIAERLAQTPALRAELMGSIASL